MNPVSKHIFDHINRNELKISLTASKIGLDPYIVVVAASLLTNQKGRNPMDRCLDCTGVGMSS
jgi:hypothetical protein